MSSADQHGFTLIGVMVATVILSALSITVAQVMSRAEPLVDMGREQFIAANLAREGLELVRAVRDTNWLSGDDRSQWLAGGLCNDSDTSYFDTDRRFTLDVDMVRNFEGVGDFEQSQLSIQDNGLWTHAANAGTATSYHRVLSIDCSTKESEPPFVIVTSQVAWQSRGQERQVVVKEKLYNWLP